MTQRTLKCIIGFFFFGPFASFGQQTTLFVLDGQSDEPIEFAHVVYFSESGNELGITDVDGRLSLDIEQPVSFAVTYVGYKTFSGEIAPGTVMTIRLKRGDYQLDDVVVTAQYLPTRPEESVIPVRILDKERIEQKGAANLGQLLNDELNIRLQTDGILGTGMSIQGLSARNVKILVDGVPVIGRLNGSLDLGQMNLQDVERIEIVEGPVSVNYGSNALAGAINIICKKPEESVFTGGGRLFYESVGVYNADASTQIPMRGEDVLRLSGGRNFFDGWSPEEEPSRDVLWNQKEQLYGKLQYRHVGSKWATDFESNGFKERIKDKGDRRSAFSNYAFDNWYTTHRLDNRLRLGREWAHSKLDVVSGYNWFRRDNVQYNRNLVDRTEEVNPDPTPHDTTTNTLFLSRGTWSSTKQDARLNFQMGYEVSYETGGGKRIEGDFQSMGDYSLFGSLQWKLGSDLMAQPGLRISHNTDYRAQPVPSLHILWKKSEQAQFRFNYARGFRAPSIKELYIEFIDANHNIVGNPGLRAEYAHHLDLSAVRTFKDKRSVHALRIKPSLFYNHLSNQIELALVDVGQFSYVNVSQTQTAGTVIDMLYTIHPDFSFKAGASLLFQSFELVDGQSEFFSEEVRMGFGYWRPSKKFGMDVTYKYTGRAPQLSLPESGVSVATMNAFHWMDVSVTQKFWKNRWSLTVGGRNLFDVRNIQTSGGGGIHSSGGPVPMGWGRSFFTSLKMSF